MKPFKHEKRIGKALRKADFWTHFRYEKGKTFFAQSSPPSFFLVDSATLRAIRQIGYFHVQFEGACG